MRSANLHAASLDDERLWEVIRRGFREFLSIPSFVIFAFIALAAGMYALDRTATGIEGHSAILISRSRDRVRTTPLERCCRY